MQHSKHTFNTLLTPQPQPRPRGGACLRLLSGHRDMALDVVVRRYGADDAEAAGDEGAFELLTCSDDKSVIRWGIRRQ